MKQRDALSSMTRPKFDKLRKTEASPVRVGERAIGKPEAQRLFQPHVDRVNFSLSAPISD
jgi:hypothetical protein